jgi:hypothetical protein
VLTTSMCSLACLFLLSACILLAAAGYRPFQPRTAAAWDRFSRVQQKAAPASPPPLAPRGSSHHAAAPAPGAISPSAGGGPADYRSPEEEDGGPPAPAPAPAPSEEAGEDDEGAQCDLFDGEWVEEPAGSYPLYGAAECPFLSDQVACRRNGRPDSGYERWRWQPRGCGGRTRSQSFHLHCNIVSDGIPVSIPDSGVHAAMPVAFLVVFHTGWAARRRWSCAGTSGWCWWATR